MLRYKPPTHADGGALSAKVCLLTGGVAVAWGVKGVGEGSGCSLGVLGMLSMQMGGCRERSAVLSLVDGAASYLGSKPWPWSAAYSERRPP